MFFIYSFTFTLSHQGQTPWLLSKGAGTGEGVVRRLGILSVAVSKDSSGSFGLTEQKRFAMRWAYTH
jgi:hypothetical protein